MPDEATPLLVLLLAILIDLIVGEPPNAWHPVAWIGRAISLFQRLGPKRGRWIPLIAGGTFMLLGIAGVWMSAHWAEAGINRLPLFLAIPVKAVALKFTFSLRGLARAACAVKSALDRGELGEARRLLSWHLVSRDTSTLNESQVAAATIESLSENASDSCIAPWLFYAVGGLPAAFVYRFINTCDAMLGYHDCDREWLGKIPARMDDVANVIPARFTAALIVAASLGFGMNPVRAASVWRRDRHQTESPNAGHPMSAAAGVLGVELEKIGHYRLGRGQRPPAVADIHRALWLLAGTTTFATVSISLALLLVHRVT